MIRYIFDEAPVRLKNAKEADPQKIGEALEKIRVAHGGELEPKHVVEEARREGHALHKFFEWDDKKAAEAFRIDQARGIIRIVRVDDPEEQTRHRAFLSINGPDGTSYRSLADIRTSRSMQARLLLQAERELEGFERRYGELRDVCALVAEARGLLKTQQDEPRAN